MHEPDDRRRTRAMTAIRVLLADDQALVRRGLRTILEAEPDLEIVGEAADGVEAVALARRRAANIVLMDVRMPRMDGLAATRLLAHPATGAPIDVLVVTTFDHDEVVFAALRAGAPGFLLKSAEPDAVVDAVRTVARGQGLVSPEVMRRLITEFASSAPSTHPDERAEALTPREHEVLLLMARGLSNAHIAGELVLEASTVKKHVANVLSKLDLSSRAQAVVYAYEHGLTRPGS
jgi:DNA-binding NarL/FixJ family response regulator